MTKSTILQHIIQYYKLHSVYWVTKKYFYNIINYENIKNILQKIILKEKFYNLTNIYYVWFDINIGTLSFLSSLTYIAILKKKKNLLCELIYIELIKIDLHYSI